MMDSMLPLPGLSPVSGKTVVAKFDGGLLSAAVDRDRGEPRGSTPPTPPGIRVRTAAVREVGLL